jgi:hypothetical protein
MRRLGENLRRRGLLAQMLFAVGPVVLGAVLISIPSVLTNYGPAAFSSGWFELLFLPMRVGGAALAAFPAFQYRPLVLAIVSFFVTGLGLYAFPVAVERSAIAHRGLVTGCEVLDVQRRDVTSTSTDANGGTTTTTTTYYDHTLRCDVPAVTKLTTRSHPAAKGDRVRVRYDPSGRIGTRRASDTTDPSGPFWLGCGVIVFGAGHRVISVLSTRRRAIRRRESRV